MPTPVATVFLRQSAASGVPSAMQQVEGVLVRDDAGCLYLDGGSRRWLIFWPADAVLDVPTGTVVAAEGVRATVGDRLVLGGTGSAPPRVDRLSGVAIPVSCRGAPVFIVDRGGVARK